MVMVIYLPDNGEDRQVSGRSLRNAQGVKEEKEIKQGFCHLAAFARRSLLPRASWKEQTSTRQEGVLILSHSGFPTET